MRLVRFHEFDPEGQLLSSWLHGNAHNNHRWLLARNQLGALANFGATLGEAQVATRRVIAADRAAEVGKAGIMTYMAIEGEEAGDPHWLGPVTVTRKSPPNRLKRPVPASLARRFSWLREEPPLPPSAAIVTGWTGRGDESKLGEMYKITAGKLGLNETGWTVEPTRTDTDNFLVAAGHVRQKDLPARYDLGGPGGTIPPLSRLYQLRRPLQG